MTYFVGAAAGMMGAGLALVVAGAARFDLASWLPGLLVLVYFTASLTRGIIGGGRD